MEESRRFAQTYIGIEHIDNAAAVNGGDAVQFDINGVYVPETPTAPVPAPAPKAAENSKRGRS
jgi:hypothetical protein